MADERFAELNLADDAFFPTDKGLYFPQWSNEGEDGEGAGEAGVFMAYDDPAAEPYLEILRANGWEGQVWHIE